jgi:hypothetical protein
VFQAGSAVVKYDFFPYEPTFTGGVRVAVGDVNGDGLMDVITGTGPGGGPNVKVFDGKTGSLLQSFFAYDAGFSGGVFVAAGDVNGDGKADIITGTDAGGGPHVKVFNGGDGTELRSFFAFDAGFTGGVRVAAGDVNGDGKADIIVGAGPGGGPQVKVFDGTNSSVLKSFFAFDPAFHNGIFVAAGDLNGDGFSDVIAGPDSGGGPNVKVFDGKTGSLDASFFALPPTFTGGVRVAAGDVNGDGTPDLITGPGAGGGPNVKIFDGSTDALLKSFFAFDAGFTGGVYVGGGIESGGAGITGASTIPLVRSAITINPSCPAGAQGGFCSGRVIVLLPAVQKIRTVKGAAVKKPTVLGKKSFKIPAGKRAKVHVALSKRALKALGKKKKFKVIARIETRDAAGNASARQKTVTLARR